MHLSVIIDINGPKKLITFVALKMNQLGCIAEKWEADQKKAARSGGH